MNEAKLSAALQTLFAELVQQVESAPPAGTVYTRTRDGIAYYYAKVPVARGRVDTFIGRFGDPAAEARATAMRQGMALAKERRRLVRTLRRERLAGPDPVLGAALDAIAGAGLFRNGAVVVGTAAYLLSEPLVGRRLPSPTLMTGDLDLATLDVALAAEGGEPMAAILQRADRSFTPVMQLDRGAPASRFRNADGYLVDLVIQTRTRDDANPVPLPELDAGAAPLQHLGWLIDQPVPTVALWGAGIPVVIPQPARFAVHKLILAQRRNRADRVKRAKDLAQAGALMAALRTFDPFALEDALDDARARGETGWARPIARSLAELAVS